MEIYLTNQKEEVYHLYQNDAVSFNNNLDTYWMNLILSSWAHRTQLLVFCYCTLFRSYNQNYNEDFHEHLVEYQDYRVDEMLTMFLNHLKQESSIFYAVSSSKYLYLDWSIIHFVLLRWWILCSMRIQKRISLLLGTYDPLRILYLVPSPWSISSRTRNCFIPLVNKTSFVIS